MPTYEYQCANCGYEFEKFQLMTASALHKCPQCGKSALKRLIGTGAAVIFRGSGFYETDYRSESYKNAARKETGAGPSTQPRAGSEKAEKKGTKAETKADSAASSRSPQEEKKSAKPKSDGKSD